MPLPVKKSKNFAFASLLIFFLVSVLFLSLHLSVRQTDALTNSGGDWTSFTFDNNDSRYQASSIITSSNVASIKEAWFFPANHSVSSTPIVQDGHVYFSDWGGNVYSLDITTGSDTGPGDWDTNVSKLLGLANFAISSTPAVANGIVYVAGSPLKPSVVVALNQTNGAKVWSTTLRTTPGGIYSSPIVYNGLVYIGISDCHTKLSGCSEKTTSLVGEIDALNAQTGAPVWRFQTGNDTTNGGWGGGVWGSVVVDPSLNSIYFGTGNTFQNTSSTCNTCSLYAYSIISLDASTGLLNWYYQVYKNWLAGHDNDFGSTPNLFSFVKNSVTYQAVGLVNKNGNYYILNRQNGALLSKLKLTNSPSANIGVGGFVYPSGASVNPEIFLPAGSGYVEAFEPSSGSTSPLWSFQTSGIMDGSEVALIPGAVLVGDGNGYLYAVSISSHAALVDQKLPNLPSGYGVYGGVTAAEGFVVIGDFDAAAKESSNPNSAGLYAFSVPSSTTTTSSSSTSTTSSTSSSSTSSSSTTSTTTTTSGSSTSSSFGIDGSAKKRAVSVTSVSISLSTSKSPDVILVFAVSANTHVSIGISDTSSLVWNTRKSFVDSSFGTSYEFYAIANQPLSSDSITVTQTKSDNLNIVGFGISGANIVSPFDSNSGLPADSTGSSTTPSVKVSTSNAHDMIIGLLGTSGAPTVKAGSGFTLVATPSGSPTAAAEYEVVTSTQTSVAVKSTLSASKYWAMIGDAIVQEPSSSTSSTIINATVIPNLVMLYLASLTGIGLVLRLTSEKLQFLSMKARRTESPQSFARRISTASSIFE